MVRSRLGSLDFVRQLLLFGGLYYAYSLTRGLADEPGVAATAFANAREIMQLERALHVFVEPGIQAWAMGSGVLIDGASWLYLNAQTSVTVGALLFLYVFRNPSFYFVRNMFIVAMGLAVIGYVLFPTAPPRMFPEWGFFDSVAHFAGVDPDEGTVSALFNPYAAIPSMHVAFALMIGWSLARVVRHRAARALWLLYPFLVVFVIVATANHFVMDAVLGALVAAVAAIAAEQLARARPAAWRFSPRQVAAS